MNNRTLFYIVAILLIIGAFYYFTQEKWIGFYYPDKNDLSKHIQSGELESLEECRVWVNFQVPLYNPTGEGFDYECGRKCRFDADYGLYICKETLR